MHGVPTMTRLGAIWLALVWTGCSSSGEFVPEDAARADASARAETADTAPCSATLSSSKECCAGARACERRTCQELFSGLCTVAFDVCYACTGGKWLQTSGPSDDDCHFACSDAGADARTMTDSLTDVPTDG